ncbi:MAG: DNA-binding response regulator [Chloroflexi bacterium]|nr:MAG: DNA-binding response regulator [Chloroflexota bacterium]
MSGPIRILLADDHAVLRAGLKLLLGEQPDMQVVGEAVDGTAVIPLTEVTKPDLILLDLTMPRLGGLEVLPLIQQKVPHVKVLILTMHDDEGYLRQALKMGVSGYVLKKAADVELLSAIRAVMRGDMYVHPTMTKVLLENVLPMSDLQSADDDLWTTLSEREQEVLQLVALGYTSREVAEKLNLSVKTVETYRSRGMEKLELRSRAALVRFALTKGLME